MSLHIFVKGSLIVSFPMTNRLWVIWHFIVSSHLFIWPTDCEYIAHFFWRAFSSHGFLWPTASEWHCIHTPFCESQSHCIFSYYQQGVSNIAHFVKGNLIMYFPMTNRLWAILNILSKATSLHSFFWPTASEWYCTFLWKAVSLNPFLWPTGSEWHCIFLWKAVSYHFLWLTACEQPCTFWWKASSFPMTNREWVTFHICENHIFFYDPQRVSDIAHLWKSHLFLWPTGCEWHGTFFKRQCCESQLPSLQT